MSHRSIELLIEDLWEAVEKVEIIWQIIEKDIPALKQNLQLIKLKNRI